MSHITDIRLRVRTLDDLATAGRACAMTFHRDQLTHKTYTGRAACLHALSLDGHPEAYEIGIVKAADGGEGFDLQVDPWQQHALMAAVGGVQFHKLRREYAAAVAIRKAKAQLAPKGFTVQRQDLANGRIRLALRHR